MDGQSSPRRHAKDFKLAARCRELSYKYQNGGYFSRIILLIGSNSDSWCQLLADATGIETRRTGASEVTAKGAAIAGLIATSRASPEDALTKWRDDNGHWRPDPQRAALYSHQYQEFCRLKELAREGWRSGGPNLAKKLQ